MVSDIVVPNVEYGATQEPPCKVTGQPGVNPCVQRAVSTPLLHRDAAELAAKQVLPAKKRSPSLPPLKRGTADREKALRPFNDFFWMSGVLGSRTTRRFVNALTVHAVSRTPYCHQRSSWGY